MAILPVYYFPPVSWFAAASGHSDLLLEVCQHYHKQEYFNRMRIPGPNKVLSLSVPIQRLGERVPLSKSLISYEQDWRKIHWRSLETSYRSSPYFEYYEDFLSSVFEQKFECLIDLNLYILNWMRDILLPGASWNFTSEYFGKGHYESDCREDFDANGKILPVWYHPKKWTQVFGDFEPDPSALDLICNKGPQAAEFLKSLSIPS